MTSRKIYLASSWRNTDQPTAVAALRMAGHDVYDFRNPPDGIPNGFRWSEIDPDWEACSAAVYREIARAAGVHIYYEGYDPVYINNRLIGIHMQGDAAPTLTLPHNTAARLEELFDGGDVCADQGRVQLPRAPGATKLYLLAKGDSEP